jgi:hypothetical protein
MRWRGLGEKRQGRWRGVAILKAEAARVAVEVISLV